MTLTVRTNLMNRLRPPMSLLTKAPSKALHRKVAPRTKKAVLPPRRDPEVQVDLVGMDAAGAAVDVVACPLVIAGCRHAIGAAINNSPAAAPTVALHRTAAEVRRARRIGVTVIYLRNSARGSSKPKPRSIASAKPSKAFSMISTTSRSN